MNMPIIIETVSHAALREGDKILLPNGIRCEVLYLLDNGARMRDCWTGFEYSYRADSYTRFTR